jgi:hypothetical protein
MNLPNGDSAVVSDEMLFQYLLNRNHPVGGPHAHLFEHLFGINLTTPQRLRSALLAAAREQEAIPGKASALGEKYEVRFQMTGKRKRHTVLSVWIIFSGTKVPHLVTAYVEKQ